MSNTSGMTSTFTVVMDSDDANDAELVVVQANSADDALHVAEETLRRNNKWANDYYSVVTFHGDVSHLVAG